MASSARVPRDHAAARSQPAICERKQRLVHALEYRIDPVDGERPFRVLDDDRELTMPATRDLIFEHCRKRSSGAAADPPTTVGGNDAERADRVDRLRSAPAPARSHAPKPAHHPPARVRLVRQSDLHVLGVTGHLRIRQSCLRRGRAGDLDRLGQPRDPDRGQPILHSFEQLDRSSPSADPPTAPGDQIYLAPVQSLRDDPSRRAHAPPTVPPSAAPRATGPRPRLPLPCAGPSRSSTG